jgi:hypothetical protein
MLPVLITPEQQDVNVMFRTELMCLWYIFMLTMVDAMVLAKCILNENELTSVCFWPELQLFLLKTEISLFGKFIEV